MPDTLELHTNQATILDWVNYGTLDAELTYFLYFVFKDLMKKLPMEFEDMENIFDVYQKYWLPFGKILTDIERNGIKVNKEML